MNFYLVDDLQKNKLKSLKKESMFHRCKTNEERKKLFRKLCFRLHPDHGGENEVMNLLIEAYEISLKEANSWKEEPKKSCKENKGIDEAVALFNEIFHLSEQLNCKVSSFIYSVYDYFLEHDKLSEKQLECLISNVESLRRKYKRKGDTDKAR